MKNSRLGLDDLVKGLVGACVQNGEELEMAETLYRVPGVSSHTGTVFIFQKKFAATN